MIWQCRKQHLDLTRPVVMGILNVTPDSFSDGGAYASPDAALAHAGAMIAAGAKIIDVGGESTRPGAAPVEAATEIRRVVPVIERLAASADVAISIDTSKPEVMAAAVAAGACIVNDVNALRAPGAARLAAELGVGVCLMHMQGEPRTMQHDPQYADVIGEVADFLVARRDACLEAGVDGRAIVVDPGIGFGKTLAHNLELLRCLPQIVALGSPVLLGVSRKSLIGRVLGGGPEQRLYGGLGLAALGVSMGVRIVRTHDVAPTLAAIDMVSAVMQGHS